MAEYCKIGLGGGCHWCTEAVFQKIKGVKDVFQGYLNTTTDYEYSEGILITYDPNQISLEILLVIHIKTHQSFHNHSMRNKYRSGVYVFSNSQQKEVNNHLYQLQKQYSKKIITEVYSFNDFKESREQIRNYYGKDPQRPFCIKYIEPKLKILRMEFSKYLK
jgi:peptide-methionine (S)-S-oxide reductase